MSKQVETTIYVQLSADFWHMRGEEQVRGIRLARTTASRPKKPIPGTVTVKLTLRLPDAAFLPLAPAAVIEIPAGSVEVNPHVDVMVDLP